MRAVITGASRGIGLELVRQLLHRGDHVEAAVRDPASTAIRELASPNLRIHQVDVADAATVAAFAAALAETAIDLVVNNAGVYGGDRQSVRSCDFDDAARTYNIDALGPLRVSLAMLPALRRGTGKKLVHITSGMGSITDNTSGGYYGYRMAKAALNMMSRSLAVDLRAEGIISFVINPGWVQTDMGGASATTRVNDSVRGILRAIDDASLHDTGEFLNWKGGRYAW